MFDIAWTEMLLVVVVAMVVVGPRDLPKVMRTVGSWIRKARGLAREFQGGIEQIARESDLDVLRKEADALKSFDPNRAMKKAIDPKGDLESSLGGSSSAGTGGSIGTLGDAPADTPKESGKPERGTDQ